MTSNLWVSCERLANAQDGVLPLDMSREDLMMKEPDDPANFTPFDPEVAGGLSEQGEVKATPQTLDHSVINQPRLTKEKLRAEGGTKPGVRECKIKREKLEFQLNGILPQGQISVDYGEDGRAEAALLAPFGTNVIASGAKGDGSFAWMTISTNQGPLSIGSVYAPTGNGGRAHRKELWEWMRIHLPQANWIFCGDFNMVEHPDDSVGPYALLHGNESRKWARFLDQGDLVDSYFCAGQRKGPRFTRQALRGERFDQARLDRVYCNNRASWCSHISLIEHDDRQSLSDHIPVVVTIVLKDDSNDTRKHFNYFKMDVALLHDPEVMKAKEVWGSSHTPGRDPRVHWDLAWGRVKKVLMTEKKRVVNLRNKQSDLKTQLQATRRVVATNPSQELIKQVIEIEVAGRKQEDADATAWRKRSRVRWLTLGDVLSRYFFIQMKGKQCTESIKLLELANGEIIEDGDQVLEEVGDYYTLLYRVDPAIEANNEERQEVLALIHTQVTLEENILLEAEPTEEEITAVVHNFPKEKSPSLDGITAEVLIACWQWMKQDCIDMIHAFWKDGLLTSQASTSVIKLIPKGGDRHFLKNWRPLTMLTITHKIAAKLLAGRIKPISPRLVSAEQTGFIAGCSILDNILAFKVGTEYACDTKQAALLLNLILPRLMIEWITLSFGRPCSR
ncbi:unnamed protein product [Calypogeia fissa]